MANIVKSGSKTFAIYPISVTVVNNVRCCEAWIGMSFRSKRVSTMRIS